MSNKDYDKIAAVEKAIKEKYGEEAIINPKAEWDENKEKEYLQQMKELYSRNSKKRQYAEKVEVNGIKISKKLLNRESLKNCPVCNAFPKSLIVVINATFNISKVEKKDGYKDGAQMKINKVKLKQIILEELEEVCGTQVPMQAQSPCADDHEASMAKADLHRLANYAAELEQMIQNGEELEGWVQAKITKAADYISSVKHYLEYEKMEGHE
jgi:hypothetical protein